MTQPRALLRWRSLGQLIAVLAAVLATALLPAGPASAHTALVGTYPANGTVLAEVPDEVRLSFNEPVRLATGGLSLYDAAGQALDVTAGIRGTDDVIRADLPDGLVSGTYLLSWRVVSRDGHPLAGSLSFSVEFASETVVAAPAPDPSTQWTSRLKSVVQGVHYTGLLLAAGLVAFSLMLPLGTPGAPRRRLRRLTVMSTVVATVSAVSLVPLSAAVELDRGLRTVTTADGWDPGVVGPELLAALFVGVGLFLALVIRRRGGLARLVALSCAAGALIGPSLVGHTRSVDPQPLLIAIGGLHLVAGAIWFAGLVGLALVLPTLDSVGAARVLSRFSAAAATSLAVLVLLGSVLAWRILGSWDNVVHTPYGVLFLLKLATVAVAVGIAVANRCLLLPRVRAAGNGGTADRSMGLIRRAISAEVAMLVVALLITGFLVDQAPHPQPDPAANGHPGDHPTLAGH